MKQEDNKGTKDVDLLLSEYFRGELDGIQAEEVEKWILSDSTNEADAKAHACINQIGAELDASNAARMENALAGIHRQSERRRRRRLMGRIGRIGSYAMAAALFFLAGRFYMSIFDKDESMCEVSTSTGVTTSTNLPDGTRVWLNSNSKITYPQHFSGRNRTVKLQGEAFFKVAPQGYHRFIVDADDVKITVKGTEFNVEAYDKENDEIRTTLSSGSIFLSYKGLDGVFRNTVEVKPGEEYTYSASRMKLIRRQVDPSITSAWKDGKIVFDNTPLADALRRIENQFNVEFLVKNRELLNNTYTGTFENQRLEAILNAFRMTSNIRFDMQIEDVANGMGMSGRQKILVL